jgi:4-alpha-glucanotransferase
MARPGVSDRALKALAREAGLAIEWVDATGRKQTVSPETLRSVLSALGLPAHNSAAIEDSRRRVQIDKRALAKTIVATVGTTVQLATRSRHATLTLEQGTTISLPFRRSRDGLMTFTAPQQAGYHRLEIDNHEHVLAVAPSRAFEPNARMPWGISVQIYALRGGRTKAFGDFSDLAKFARTAGRNGADAVAVSPLHAGLPGVVEHYSPYSPSSRFALNVLFAATPRDGEKLDRQMLIAWRAASEAKLKALDRAYELFLRNSRARSELEMFVRAGGSRLLSHARFEALHARFAASGRTDWRRWPAPYRNANSADATRLGRGDRELERHLFRQWLADTHLSRAQKSAKDTGMTIGIIADLAVGLDPRGSHAWSAPHELLNNLSVGAPPDALGPEGQDWGLTTLCPFAMRADGYASYLATLRASIRHAGGIRVDHAMGLTRLWVIPRGASSVNGAYLSYPFEDLLRLLILESARNRAVVIAEDLGTVPPGFRERIAQAGLLGMRVLLFERKRNGSFKAPSNWDRAACALTTTHDLPTVSGWWRARDLDWRERISKNLGGGAAQQGRASDREQLWRSFKRSHCAAGPKPPPAEEQGVVDAAITFVGKTRSKLAIVPIEDIIGEIEQPNLPGTVDEHPNWRRRLPPHNGLDKARARRRLEILASERRRR